MTNLLDELVTYLASHVSLEPGVSACYNEMLDETTQCLLLQDIPTMTAVDSQIDAEVHRIRVTVRDASNAAAYLLAGKCYRWLLTDDLGYDTDHTVDTSGFITMLSGTTISCQLLGNPVWDKADQQGRKYYCFYAEVISPRMSV